MTKLNKIRSPHVATTTHLPVNHPCPAHPCPRRRLPLPTHDACHRMRPTAGHSAARVHARLPHRSWPQRPQWIAVAAPPAAPQPAAVAAPHDPGFTFPWAEGAADAGSLPVEPPDPAAQVGAAHTGQPAHRVPRAHREGRAPPRRAVSPHKAAAVVRRSPTPPPSRLPGGSGRPHRRPPPPSSPARWTTARSAGRRAPGGAGVARRAGGAAATGRRAAFRTAAGGRFGGGAEASRGRVTVPQTRAAASELPARPTRARPQTRGTDACGAACPSWVPAAVRAPAAAGRRSYSRCSRLSAVGKGDGHAADEPGGTVGTAARPFSVRRRGRHRVGIGREGARQPGQDAHGPGQVAT